MSRLALNEPIEHYKEFYGPNKEHMSLLIKDGRLPLSVAGLLERRLEVLKGSSEEVVSAWWNNYFDTGDGVFYHPDGNLKVVLGAQPIRDLNENSQLSAGALVLGSDRESSIAVYDALEGAEFSRAELEGLVGKLLTQADVLAHPIWNALVPDKELLKKYVGKAFAQGKESFGYDKMMGIWIVPAQSVARGRLWCVRGTGSQSDTVGYDLISYSGGRLVGVAPEAQRDRD